MTTSPIPKENLYRSLHTAVVGPEGHNLEIQIRTEEMHRHAELGVAAHWRYKEGGGGDAGYEEKIAWLRQLLEWKDEERSANDFVDRFKSEAFQERVYVLTPQGRIIDLPQDSTPLDFAYAVHTEVGHRCRGAKINGRIVPLTYAVAERGAGRGADCTPGRTQPGLVEHPPGLSENLACTFTRTLLVQAPGF